MIRITAFIIDVYITFMMITMVWVQVEHCTLLAPSLIKTPLPSSGSGVRLGSGSVSTEPRNVITVPNSLGAIAARRTFYHPTVAHLNVAERWISQYAATCMAAVGR